MGDGAVYSCDSQRVVNIQYVAGRCRDGASTSNGEQPPSVERSRVTRAPRGLYTMARERGDGTIVSQPRTNRFYCGQEREEVQMKTKKSHRGQKKAHEHALRCGIFPELRPTVIAKLMQVMRSNPYAQFFRSLHGQAIDETTTIRINKDPALDQQVNNAPTSSEVAAILLDSSASSKSEGPYIVVSGRSNETHRIMHFYGCYDPLQYPLLFPNGESGWHRGLPRYK